MNISKAMTVRNGLVLICAGVLAGVALRALLMFRFFDYSTCFYTDGGVTAWLGLLLPVLTAIVSGVMCNCSKRSLSQYTPGRAPASGAMALISGLLLIYTGAVLLIDYLGFMKTGATGFESVRQGLIHLFYMVACLAFGLVQLAAARVSFSCEDTFLRMPVLYGVAVLWGMANLVMIYVFYAKFASLVENIFTVVGGAALLLSLLYMTKLRAGVEPPASTLRMFITGGVAVVLVVAYDLVNLLAQLAGKSYFGEKPIEYSLCELGVGLYVLVFMMDCYRSQVDRSLDDGLHQANHFENESGHTDA